ncbi:hypothetical protein GCM10010358_82370 [Streptomyces minutiscleroticus]|uniref:Uncharacterized protein n=1 Tax=Streptomyces minutiscleroticus TaxID=68238 RepID=A0A918P3N9_9ACTN|nr:hypothetical protein GCM10010358_82370 [Streptomyces minutiscleroticus]
MTRSALQNAGSIAALFLITEAVIADKPEKAAAPAGGMPGGEGTSDRPLRLIDRPAGRGRHPLETGGAALGCVRGVWMRLVSHPMADGENAPGCREFGLGIRTAVIGKNDHDSCWASPVRGSKRTTRSTSRSGPTLPMGSRRMDACTTIGEIRIDFGVEASTEAAPVAPASANSSSMPVWTRRTSPDRGDEVRQTRRPI